MPYLKLSSNIALENQQSEPLIHDLSQLMAHITHKPERYVMVAVIHNPNMLFAGTNEPLAYLECKSIGLTKPQAQQLAAALCTLLHERLAIAPERIYIEFSNCPAEFWGWNGSTFG